MPRKPRIDFVGAWHHVMHRGARRAPIFLSDDHCFLFFEIIEEVVLATEIEVHAYSLMPNHYHLLVRSRHGNLSEAMRRLNASYTQRLNFLHRWDGPVFRGRFRSQLVEDESSLPYLLAYIHLNPLRAGLITRLHSRGWTSHRAYLGRDVGHDWLETSYFESIFGDTDALHNYVLDLHRGRLSWPEQMAMDSGWLKISGEGAIKAHSLPSDTRFVNADDVIARVCSITGVGEKDLLRVAHGPNANPARRFAVWSLSNRTRLTQREIGQRLNMSTSQVAHVLRRINLRKQPFAEWLNNWIDSQ